jgi:hypothetical protein
MTTGRGERGVAGAVKRGRPRVEEKGMTLAATRPWEKAGMGRTTWFNRKRERRGK